MPEQSRRRFLSDAVTVSSTSTSGSAGTLVGVGRSFDDVVAWINVTTLTAGGVTFSIEASHDNGTTWFPVPETLGNTAQVTATGQFRLAARCPIGSSHRLTYVIVTGPTAFSFKWEFSKRGEVTGR